MSLRELDWRSRSLLDAPTPDGRLVEGLGGVFGGGGRDGGPTGDLCPRSEKLS